MKFSRYLENSFFKATIGFESLEPDVTVLLPTFRRGDSGLLAKCIDSILEQTFKNFELIVIDDASTDSTAEILDGYLKKDSRVSVIRHNKNVGLPALSNDEGILRARARKIFFAFDDNEFLPDAISTLYEFQKQNPESMITYGQCQIDLADGSTIKFGKEDFDITKMLRANYIPNSPLLVDRKIFETVGLLDPHVSMTRLCDWDLLIRIGKKFHFSRVDKVLVKEDGPNQSDSLGNSHHLDFTLVREWMSRPRDQQLRPDQILHYDVSARPEDLSHISRLKILDLISERFPWVSSDRKDPGKPFCIFVARDYDGSEEILISHIQATGVTCIPVTYGCLFAPHYKDLLISAAAILLYEDQAMLNSVASKLNYCKIPLYFFSSEELGRLSFNQLSKTIRTRADLITLFVTFSKNLVKASEFYENSQFKFSNAGIKQEVVGNPFSQIKPPSFLQVSQRANSLISFEKRERPPLGRDWYIDEFKRRFRTQGLGVFSKVLEVIIRDVRKFIKS